MIIKKKIDKEVGRILLDGGIDFYVDSGKLAGLPSTLIQIKNNKILIKRKGVAQKL